MASHHRESAALIDAPPHEVFAFIDDHARFSSHMSKTSWMMGGGRMSIDLDAARGQAVGSHIRLSGTVFGIRLSLDEVVTRRRPPTDKVWETVGAPRLLVIGSYTMGIRITPESDGSRLRVFIDYNLPTGWTTHWLGFLFGGLYARWCVQQMTTGALKHFNRHQAVAAASAVHRPELLQPSVKRDHVGAKKPAALLSIEQAPGRTLRPSKSRPCASAAWLATHVCAT